MSADPNEVCGITPFALPEDHPFTVSCQMHDRLFQSHEDGFVTLTRAEADKALLRSMLTIAKEKESTSLRLQAYAYYGLARVFGRIRWRDGK